MQIVGMMLVRNEEWVIRASLAAALRWCHKVAVMCHACSDRTSTIVGEMAGLYPEKIKVLHVGPSEHWDEMNLRDELLSMARVMGGTHFGLIDADEIPTANVLPDMRRWCERLLPGQVLDVPMVPVWGDLEHYRHDASVWSRSMLSVAVADNPGRTLTYQPRKDGYQHHNRVPAGATGRYSPFASPKRGGVMHLQFADKRRLLMKHVWYRMIEKLRWPDRENSHQLNTKYDQALDETDMKREAVPDDWWADLDKDKIWLDQEPWHQQEIRRLLDRHGIEAFEGLDLKGVEQWLPMKS
jgi:hypothetical protein